MNSNNFLKFTLVLAWCLSWCASFAVHAQSPYPSTPSKPVIDVYHGISVADPYRWMEDQKSPEMQGWMRSQADYAAAVLAGLPGRAALRARLSELADAGESTGGYKMVAGRLFYFKRKPGQNQASLWVREGLQGAERELLDPNNLPGEPGKHAVDWRSVSPDGMRLAIGLSKGGSENSVLRVLDTVTGKFLADKIDRTGLNEGGMAWLPDGSGFIYNRHPFEERYNKSALFLHKLGQDPAKDVAVFGWAVSPKTKFDVPDLFHAHVSKDSPWVLAEVLHGDAAERSYWVASLDQVQKLGGQAAWRQIISPSDKVTRAVLTGSTVYALSQRKASRRDLLSLDLKATKPSFKTVMPAGESVLQELMLSLIHI